MDPSNGFHAGEREMQQDAGQTAIANRNQAVLGNSVALGARPFIASQSMVVLGSVDTAGRMWASLLFGQPGFVYAPGATTIRLDVPEHERDLADPLWANLAGNPQVGMLFIELGARQRYRVNGRVQRLDARGAEVAVEQAYANCPRYIHRRRLRRLGETTLPVQAAQGSVLRGSVEQIVRQADTLFVASRHAGSGADVSHRGGEAGFVKVIDQTTIRIPDYPGNSLFNTLGNFKLNPHAGLCIPDFVHGQLLQLTGSAVVVTHQDDPDHITGGTCRYWDFKVDQWVLRDTPQPMEWISLDGA